MIKKFLIRLIDTDIEKLVDEKVGSELSRRFEKTENYLEDRIKQRLCATEGNLRTMLTNELCFNEERLNEHIDRLFGDRGRVERMIKEATGLLLVNEIKNYIGGESFIDSVIERIKKKQL